MLRQIKHVLLALAQSRSLPGAQDESPDEPSDESPYESRDHTSQSHRPVSRSHEKNAEKFLTGKEKEKREAGSLLQLGICAGSPD